MPRVFIAQEGPFDYSTAQRYGEVVFCSVQEITPAVGRGRLNEVIVNGIYEAMKDYEPGEDYILASGSPIAIAHCLSVAYNKSKIKQLHKLLKWDAQRNTYLVYEVRG